MAAPARRPRRRNPTPLPVRRPAAPAPTRNPLAGGVGLVAGVLALAAGGVALGLELERRVVSKRIARSSQGEVAELLALHSPGPTLTTPDGVRLHTEIDEGTDTDLTLVLVHGYALNLDCWHFQREHFRGRIPQVLYDQRSHGRSTRSDPALCRVPQLSLDLEQVLTEVVPPGPVILVGHSMGGMTIMHLAQSRPELFGDRIRGVALFSTAAGGMADYSPIKQIPGQVFSRVAEPLLATLNRVPELVDRSRRAGSDLGYVVTARMAFGSAAPASYVEFVSEMLAETSLDVVADFYPTFAELDEYAALSTMATIETAVVGGEDDMLTPIEHTARIMELLPSARARRVPDCGHLGMIEHHEIFNAVLDDLVARVRARLADDQGPGVLGPRSPERQPHIVVRSRTPPTQPRTPYVCG